MFILSLSSESLESFLVSDPQPLKHMARLSQTMGPTTPPSPSPSHDPGEADSRLRWCDLLSETCLGGCKQCTGNPKQCCLPKIYHHL